MVNALIKRVKTKEARKQGAELQNQHLIFGQEFVVAHYLLIKKICRPKEHRCFWKGSE
jgi:hypothetical protein